MAQRNKPGASLNKAAATTNIATSAFYEARQALVDANQHASDQIEADTQLIVDAETRVATARSIITSNATVIENLDNLLGLS